MTKDTVTVKKETQSRTIQKKMSSSSRDDSMQPNIKSKNSPLEVLESYEIERESKDEMYSSSSKNNNFLNMPNTRNKRERDVSDTVSVTSERIIDEPLRQLSKKASGMNYDHGQYMELENELLKTELRNLKNKYNAKKTELTEKCDILQRKN